MTRSPQLAPAALSTLTGDRSVTRLQGARVTDPKSLTLLHRQRSGESVTIGHQSGYPQGRVTGTPIDVVARARVRARKTKTRSIGHIGHPDPSHTPHGGPHVGGAR